MLREGALVLATERAAGVLAGRLPEEAELAIVPGETAVDVAAAVRCPARARATGGSSARRGPRLFGSLVAEGLVDELFLTVSPLLAGRAPAEDRLAIVEGVALLPEREHRGSLRSARLHGEHLFLRYGFG